MTPGCPLTALIAGATPTRSMVVRWSLNCWIASITLLTARPAEEVQSGGTKAAAQINNIFQSFIYHVFCV